MASRAGVYSVNLPIQLCLVPISTISTMHSDTLQLILKHAVHLGGSGGAALVELLLLGRVSPRPRP